MRFGLVLAALAAIAVMLVQVRRQETVVRHEMQQMRNERVQIRRKLWDQQVRLGYLTGPARVRQRVGEVAIHRSADENRRVAQATKDEIVDRN